MTEKAQTNRKSRKNPFSLFFVMVLVVIISVSAGFSFFYYNTYNKAARDEVIRERQEELETSEQYLENLIRVFRKQMLSMLYSQEIYTWDSETANYKDYHEVIDYLNANAAKHSAIHSIYAVFEDRNVVLTASEGYFPVDSFYDDIWTEYSSGEMTRMKENEKIGISGVHRLEPRSLNDASVISIVTQIQNEGNWITEEGTVGYLVVNLYQDKLVQTMDIDKWDTLGSENELAILSSDGSVIYNSTGSLLALFVEENLEQLKNPDTDYLIKEAEGHTYLCQKTYFWNADWYVLRISQITEQVNSLVWARNVLYLALIVCIVAIAVVLLSIWKLVYQPYTRLVEKIKRGDKAFENEGSMEYLEEIIAKTLDTREMLLESYIERILLGGYRISEEEDDNIIDVERFWLLLISQKNQDRELGHTTANVQMTALKSCVRQYMQEQELISIKECYYIGMMDMSLAVLLEPQSDAVGTLSCIQMLPQYLKVHRNIDVVMGVSVPHTGMEEMHRAYREARDALGIYYFDASRDIFFYEKTSQMKREFYIENSVKVDIFTNNLYGMKIDEAKDALGMIVADLRKDLETVVYYNIPNFFSRIFERVYRAVRNIGLEPERFFRHTNRDGDHAFNTWEFDTMDEAIQNLYGMLDRILEYQKSQGEGSRKNNKQWAKIMLEYVERNYDKGISLAQMAEDLGLDESYLSKQFKEKVGISFVQYVTKCRMEKAKELLQNPSMKLADIAEILGMGNVQSFIRTFKKYEGMTPGQYRETTSV